MILRLHNLTIRTRSRAVYLGIKRLKLTAAEYVTLELLALADGLPTSRSEITERALRRPWRIDDRSPDQIIFSLRKKLPKDADGETLIASMRGQGYWMEPWRRELEPVEMAAGMVAGMAG